MIFAFSERKKICDFCWLIDNVYYLVKKKKHFNFGLYILLCLTLNDVHFCLGRHELALGNTFIAEKGSKPPNKEVPPEVDIYLY